MRPATKSLLEDLRRGGAARLRRTVRSVLIITVAFSPLWTGAYFYGSSNQRPAVQGRKAAVRYWERVRAEPSLVIIEVSKEEIAGAWSPEKGWSPWTQTKN